MKMTPLLASRRQASAGVELLLAFVHGARYPADAAAFAGEGWAGRVGEPLAALLASRGRGAQCVLAEGVDQAAWCAPAWQAQLAGQRLPVPRAVSPAMLLSTHGNCAATWHQIFDRCHGMMTGGQVGAEGHARSPFSSILDGLPDSANSSQ